MVALLLLASCADRSLGGDGEADTTDATEGSDATELVSPYLLMSIGGVLYAGHSETEALTPLPLDPPEVDRAFSGCTPDGRAFVRRVATPDDRELRLVDTATMTERVLPVPSGASAAHVLPDRTAVAVSIPDETFYADYTTYDVLVVATDGGGELWRTQTPWIVERPLAASPDSRWWAVSYEVLSEPHVIETIEAGVRLYPARGGEYVEFAIGSEEIRSAQWLSNSRQLLVAAEDEIYLVDVDTAEASKLVSGLDFRSGPDDDHLALRVTQQHQGPAPDSADVDLVLRLSDPQLTHHDFLDAEPGYGFTPEGWSPDGARLLASWTVLPQNAAPDREFQWWIVDEDGADPHPIFVDTPYGVPQQVQWCDLSGFVP